MTSPNYWKNELVTEDYDPDYGSSQRTVLYYECSDCGSLVADTYTHSQWHEALGK